MYLTNKYTTWYNNIIAAAKSRNFVTRTQAKAVLGYTERHHIIPQCLKGSNNKDNIVFLTAKEHFICHLLLTKMTTGKDRYRMLQAATAFIKWASLRHHRTVKVNSRVFEALKIEKSNALKELWKTDPLYREQALSGLNRLVTDKQHQTSMSNRRKELWKDQVYREKMAQRPPQPSKRVMVFGVEYATLTEVARAFNITTNTVCKRCLSKSANFVNWYYI